MSRNCPNNNGQLLSTFDHLFILELNLGQAQNISSIRKLFGEHNLQKFLQILRQKKPQTWFDFQINLLPVFFVLDRQNNLLDSGSLGCRHFLLPAMLAAWPWLSPGLGMLVCVLNSLSTEHKKDNSKVPSSLLMSGRSISFSWSWTRHCSSHFNNCWNSSFVSAYTLYSIKLCGGPTVHGWTVWNLWRSRQSGSGRSSLESSLSNSPLHWSLICYFHISLAPLWARVGGSWGDRRYLDCLPAQFWGLAEAFWFLSAESTRMGENKHSRHQAEAEKDSRFGVICHCMIWHVWGGFTYDV